MYKKCWECGQEVEFNIQDQLDKTFDLAYDKGYKQAVRDMKLAGDTNRYPHTHI
jgi:acetyl-CoA carboxylase alpha subunit